MAIERIPRGKFTKEFREEAVRNDHRGEDIDSGGGPEVAVAAINDQVLGQGI